MKISCNVIQDLLPLYIDKITSKESNQLIEEHLSECEKCKQELELLNSKEPTPLIKSEELIPLKMMKNNIYNRKRKAVILISMIVFLVMFAIFSYLTKPIYSTYEKSGIMVNKNEKYEMYANFTGDITAYKIDRYVSENGKNVVEIEAWTSIWDKILGKSTPSILVASSETAVDTVYYCENTEGDNMKIVYGENPYPNGGIVVLTRLVLGYYFGLAFILTLLIGMIWFFVRKDRLMDRICKFLFFIPLSYVISAILLQNRSVTFSAPRDFIMNIIAAIAIYGICILGLASYRQYKEDRSVHKW